ncbi:MAG: hypothetical protein QOI10_1971 [Solirubrobacterales bacterium]|jgi:uncharacterized NAD(P)/FAD-binding protein YdhS|nr:hypothetical protein [Solirubrobacterales bacterium]
MTPPTVAIVGGGASGTLLAAQLLRRHHPRGVRVVLIERRPEVGRGVAYSTPHEYHRLNVPAEQMGALPRDPRHFMRWASRNGHGVVVGDFAPRGLFGEYLESLLAEAERAAASSALLERLRGDVASAAVDELRRRARLELASGEVVEADRVVLALGNLAPADPPGADPQLLASGRYEADPWAAGLGERAAGDDLVLLLGTGLTMVDVALTLGKETFAPRLLAVSRKGLVPQSHRRGAALPPRRFHIRRERVRLDELVDEVARELSDVRSTGGDWRQVIDSMRPVTNQIWHRLSDTDRRRFVDRLSRRWDVHRHRMAPEVATMLERLRRTHRLAMGRASVEGMRVAGDRVIVTLDRGERGVEELSVARVINCTGPALDLRAAREPLLEGLLATGAIRPGPLRLGLDHDSRAALVDASGAASRVLFGIGPMRKGRLWETTAIPEIRTQAFDLADQISADLARAAARGPELALAG